jgi:hypothetical protein
MRAHFVEPMSSLLGTVERLATGEYRDTWVMARFLGSWGEEGTALARERRAEASAARYAERRLIGQREAERPTN